MGAAAQKTDPGGPPDSRHTRERGGMARSHSATATLAASPSAPAAAAPRSCFLYASATWPEHNRSSGSDKSATNGSIDRSHMHTGASDPLVPPVRTPLGE